MMVRPVHELRRRNARLPVVVVDSLVGKTSIFATHPVMVKPGTESRVLAAIAAKLGAVVTGALAIDAAHAAPEAGLPADVIAGAAGVLAGSKKLGVIVRAEIGKASNWDQVGMLAGLIAAAKNGGVAACLTYGNAMGAWRLARAAGVARTEPAANVIALGADLVSVLSREECAATLDGVKMLAAAGAMPSPTLGAADVVLPMALNFEAGGTTVTGSGEIITVDSLADAPGDALPARELLNRFAKALGSSSVERAVDVKALEKPPAGDAQHLADRGQPGLSSAPAGEFQAVTWSDAVHFHTGTLTAQCQWPLYMANGPVVLLNANDSGELGIRENDRVQLTSEKAQGEAKAQLVKGQTPGVVAVSGGFPAMRGLFGWSKSRPAGPVFVKVKKA
jgi:anaerobic selenocysteine-containing dehydrogenase